MHTLPTWAAALAMTIALVSMLCLALFLASIAVRQVIEARIRLQRIRRKSEVKALNKLQGLYEDERDARKADNNALIEEISRLQIENDELKKGMERKDELMARVKVASL